MRTGYKKKKEGKMDFKKLIQPLLAMVLPLIKEFIESKVVPALIRKTYQKFDDYSNKMIEKLTDLVEKIKNTEDEKKRKRHLDGFELGLKTLRVIADKLTQACNILDKEVWDYENGEEVKKDDLVAEEVIPF